MLVAMSMNSSKNRKVYHKLSCMYAKRIKKDNCMVLGPEHAERLGYCECKFCAGLRGEIKTGKQKMKSYEKKYDVSIVYREETDTLYVKTDVGFWKIYLNKQSKKYVLCHRNYYDKEIPFETAIYGGYHRQHDVKEMQDIHCLIEYISKHDKAKVVIRDDYRKLPKATRRQKKYYHQAERKVKEQETKRIDDLFLLLEQKNPSMRMLAAY